MTRREKKIARYRKSMIRTVPILLLLAIILGVLIVLLCRQDKVVTAEECQTEEGLVTITYSDWVHISSKSKGWYTVRFTINGKLFSIHGQTNRFFEEKKALERVEKEKIVVRAYYSDNAATLLINDDTERVLQLENASDGTVYWNIEQYNATIKENQLVSNILLIIGTVIFSIAFLATFISWAEACYFCVVLKKDSKKKK